MSDFLKQWGDKVLLFVLIIIFLLVAVHGYHDKNADMASFSSDLVKQLISAILTLLVASRMPWPKANGGNGNGTTSVDTTISGTGTATVSASK